MNLGQGLGASALSQAQAIWQCFRSQTQHPSPFGVVPELFDFSGRVFGNGKKSGAALFAPFDGDAVFVLSTASEALPAPDPLTVTRIGELAASTLARAITRGVHEARRQSGAVA